MILAHARAAQRRINAAISASRQCRRGAAAMKPAQAL
jgi:hypothetical protein